MKESLPLALALLLIGGCGGDSSAALGAASAGAGSADARAASGRERYAAGKALLEAGDANGALRELVAAAAYAPESADIQCALGRAYMGVNDLIAARATFENALERSPKHAGMLEQLGQVDYAEGHLKAAIERWKAALAIEPDRESVKAMLAKAEREAPVEEKFSDLFTQHFHLSLESGAVPPRLARDVADALERAYSTVGLALDQYPGRPVPVLLYGDREFTEVTGSHGWVGALFDGKIRIPLRDAVTKDAATIARVTIHEYTHACVYTLAPRCPTWLHEGLAQHFEGQRADPQPLSRALADGSLAGIASLSSQFVAIRDVARVRLVYGESLSFVDFLLARGGTGGMSSLLRELGRGTALDDAVERTYGAKLYELDAAWRERLAR